MEKGVGVWQGGNKKLEQLINNQIVRCTDEGQDRYGRTLGICYVGDMDLQAEMVNLQYGSSLLEIF